MTAGLTRMQSRALAFIERYIAQHSISPTYDEIAAELGLASKSGVNRLVTGLEQRGRVRKLAGRARGIEIVGQDSDFHLKRILDAISCSGFIGKDDPIIAEARAAMGGSDANSRP